MKALPGCCLFQRHAKTTKITASRAMDRPIIFQASLVEMRSAHSELSGTFSLARSQFPIMTQPLLALITAEYVLLTAPSLGELSRKECCNPSSCRSRQNVPSANLLGPHLQIA